MKLKLANINLDEATQCRAEMRQEVIEDYSAQMLDGVKFPPIEAYGTREQCWIGDGWHRVLAARKCDFKDIEANLHPGGRIEAIKAGLAANATHGLRRSNQDKRRAVEIALREFPGQTDNALATLCGVDNHTVAAVRTTLGNSQPEIRTGRDGKQYPATKKYDFDNPAPGPAAPDPDEPCGKCKHPLSEHFQGGECHVLLTPDVKASQCACCKWVPRFVGEPGRDKEMPDHAEPDRSAQWKAFQDDAADIAATLAKMELDDIPTSKRTAAVLILSKLETRIKKFSDRLCR